MSDLARGQIEMSLQRRPPVLLSTADLPVSSCSAIFGIMILIKLVYRIQNCRL